MDSHHNDEEIARVEGRLCRLEEALEQRYRDLGNGLLAIADQEQREINRLVDAVIVARKELSRARCDIQCVHCMTMNPMQSKYCHTCGTKLFTTTNLRGEIDEKE